MNYKFDTFNNGKDQFLIIEFEDIKNGNVLSGLFDMNEEYDYWIDTVDRVVSGESAYEELGIEGFFVDVYPDRTEVEFEFEENPDLAVAEIPTPVFKEILAEWFKELKKFNEQYNM